MDGLETSIVAGATIAVIKAVRDLMDKNFRTIVYVGLAGVIAGLAAQFGLEGTNFVTGFFTGLAASGLYTVASVAGKDA